MVSHDLIGVDGGGGGRGGEPAAFSIQRPLWTGRGWTPSPYHLKDALLPGHPSSTLSASGSVYTRAFGFRYVNQSSPICEPFDPEPFEVDPEIKCRSQIIHCKGCDFGEEKAPHGFQNEDSTVNEKEKEPTQFFALLGTDSFW